MCKLREFPMPSMSRQNRNLSKNGYDFASGWQGNGVLSEKHRRFALGKFRMKKNGGRGGEFLVVRMTERGFFNIEQPATTRLAGLFLYLSIRASRSLPLRVICLTGASIGAGGQGDIVAGIFTAVRTLGVDDCTKSILVLIPITVAPWVNEFQVPDRVVHRVGESI